MDLWLRAFAVLSEDPGMVSWFPHGGSHPSITLIPGDMTISFGLRGYKGHLYAHGI